MDCIVAVHAVLQVGFLHGPFQRGEQERRSLSVVPDMDAGAFAAAPVGTGAFPAVKRAVFKAETGGTFQGGKTGRCTVDDGGIEAGIVEQIPELHGLAAQFIETGDQFVRRLVGVLPLCCVIVAPGAGNALPVRLFQRPVAPRYGPFGDAPGDEELHHPFFAGFQRKMCCQIAVVVIPAPGGALFIHAVCPGRERFSGSQFIEIHFQRIGPAAAIPVRLPGNIGRIFQQGQDKLIFLAVGHSQAGAAAADRIDMPFLFPRVLDHADRCCLHGLSADILKGVFQHGAGQR